MSMTAKQLGDLIEERLRDVLPEILDDYFEDEDDDAEVSVAPTAAGPAQTRSYAYKRDMACIAPSCPNKSKGPRFHYLCEKHMKVSTKQVKEWQAIRQQIRAATR